MTEMHFLAAQKQRAAIRAVRAAEYLEKRGFARAVFPNERVNFTRQTRKAHVVQGGHAGKCLADAPDFQQRLRCVCISSANPLLVYRSVLRMSHCHRSSCAA